MHNNALANRTHNSVGAECRTAIANILEIKGEWIPWHEYLSLSYLAAKVTWLRQYESSYLAVIHIAQVVVFSVVLCYGKYFFTEYIEERLILQWQ